MSYFPFYTILVRDFLVGKHSPYFSMLWAVMFPADRVHFSLIKANSGAAVMKVGLWQTVIDCLFAALRYGTIHSHTTCVRSAHHQLRPWPQTPYLTLLLLGYYCESQEMCFYCRSKSYCMWVLPLFPQNINNNRTNYLTRNVMQLNFNLFRLSR